MSGISYYYHLYVLYVLPLKKILFLQMKIKPNVNCKISVRYFSSSLHGLERTASMSIPLQQWHGAEEALVAS
jgi:hypothetical protein